jgi:hypothetical protein
MFRLACLFVVCAGIVPLAAAQPKGVPVERTVVLQPLRDATIYNDAPTPGEIGNGAGQRLFAGRTQSAVLRRALLDFPLDGFEAGATILEVGLALTMDKTSDPTAVAFELRGITRAWSTGASDPPGDTEGAGAQAQAGDATWIHASYTGTAWTTPGGDFAAAASATTDVAGNGVYTWSSPAMAADLQAWLDGGGAAGTGWILRGGEGTNGSAKRFHSGDSDLVSARPALTVRYTYVPDDPEGEGEGEAAPHSADQNGDLQVGLSELLRVIQFYNSDRFGCQEGSEDGFAPNADDETCVPHASDYNPQDWVIGLSELLRLIQIYNSGGYTACPDAMTEDGFCPGVG